MGIQRFSFHLIWSDYNTRWPISRNRLRFDLWATVKFYRRVIDRIHSKTTTN